MKDRMQNNEIVKDLRSIVGKYNLYQKDWQTIESAISEINSLQAENEQLKAEIERLKKTQNTIVVPTRAGGKVQFFIRKVDAIKTEAVKEFAERLEAKKHECGCNYRKKPVYAVTEALIYETLKEMGCE